MYGVSYSVTMPMLFLIKWQTMNFSIFYVLVVVCGGATDTLVHSVIVHYFRKVKNIIHKKFLLLIVN